MHPDSGMQGICNNMVRKNQEMIAKFFGYIIRVNKCERIVLDAAIEEAGMYKIHLSFVNPRPNAQIRLFFINLRQNAPYSMKTINFFWIRQNL